MSAGRMVARREATKSFILSSPAEHGGLPIIYVTNWSSPKFRGRGNAYTIMTWPRRFETGAGAVDCLIPAGKDLTAWKSGAISIDEYRHRYVTGAPRAEFLRIRAGALEAIRTSSGRSEPCEAGDSLCCACSVEDAAASRCHRAWSAALLHQAGWRVVLDGAEIDDIQAERLLAGVHRHGPQPVQGQLL